MSIIQLFKNLLLTALAACTFSNALFVLAPWLVNNYYGEDKNIHPLLLILTRGILSLICIAALISWQRALVKKSDVLFSYVALGATVITVCIFPCKGTYSGMILTSAAMCSAATLLIIYFCCSGALPTSIKTAADKEFGVVSSFSLLSINLCLIPHKTNTPEITSVCLLLAYAFFAIHYHLGNLRLRKQYPHRCCLEHEVTEKEDMLERNTLINFLTSKISTYFSQSSDTQKPSIVIGLFGAWGSGKTQLMYFVEKKLCNFNSTLKVNEDAPTYHTCSINLWAMKDRADLWQNTCEVLEEAYGISSSYATHLCKRINKHGGISAAGDASAIAHVIFRMRSDGADAQFDKLQEKLTQACPNLTVVLYFDNLDRAPIKMLMHLLPLLERLRRLPRLIIILGIATDELIRNATRKHYSPETIFGHLLKLTDFTYYIPSTPPEILSRFFKQKGNALASAQLNPLTNHFINHEKLVFETPRQLLRTISALMTWESKTFSHIPDGNSNPLQTSFYAFVRISFISELIHIFYPEVYSFLTKRATIFDSAKSLNKKVFDYIIESVKQLPDNRENTILKNQIESPFLRSILQCLSKTSSNVWKQCTSAVPSLPIQPQICEQIITSYYNEEGTISIRDFLDKFYPIHLRENTDWCIRQVLSHCWRRAKKSNSVTKAAPYFYTISHLLNTENSIFTKDEERKISSLSLKIIWSFLEYICFTKEAPREQLWSAAYIILHHQKFNTLWQLVASIVSLPYMKKENRLHRLGTLSPDGYFHANEVQANSPYHTWYGELLQKYSSEVFHNVFFHRSLYRFHDGQDYIRYHAYETMENTANLRILQVAAVDKIRNTPLGNKDKWLCFINLLSLHYDTTNRDTAPAISIRSWELYRPLVYELEQTLPSITDTATLSLITGEIGKLNTELYADDLLPSYQKGTKELRLWLNEIERIFSDKLAFALHEEQANTI